MGARKVICALDTTNVDEALRIVKRLSPHVGGFKVGHALTLPYGLDILGRFREAGAHRIFLDLKFHDIPNSVALAVREAARHGVWMMTVHVTGGPAMMTAAVEESAMFGEEGPLLVGVSVLTSLDQHILSDHLGVARSLEDQMVYLSRLAIDCGLDGAVCSSHELKAVRTALGKHGILVTPGIRMPNDDVADQVRVGTATQALSDGADYLVIGRSLTDTPDPEAALAAMGLLDAAR